MTLDMNERLELFEIREKDRKLVASLGKILEPHMDDILARFYETASRIPEAAQMFSSPEMIKHTQQAQKKHWLRLMSGNFDQDYIDSCERIGRIHFKIQLPFVHYLSGYARATADLQASLIKSLGKFSSLSANKLTSHLGMLQRITALDTELVINAYFEESQAQKSMSFNYLSEAVAKLAEGNLDCRMDGSTAPDFPEEYDGLKSSWNASMESLQSVLGSIDKTVIDVKSSSDMIDQEAGGLAERAESQAASLEQTNAAMQMLTESVRTTADTSKQMDGLTNQARKEIVNGSSVMSNAAAAMERISQASEEITKIISLIDDISFQTNLLALNAGVEAARAGEAGRGFAVVAEEVRNLAGSSSDAAKQIKDLISKSADEVNSGVQLVGSASEILNRLVSTFDEVTGLTEEVSSAATDQSHSLQEVSAAVADMDRITQQNAAMANSTTERAKTLVTATDQLSQQLTHFDLGASPKAGAYGAAA